MEQESLLLATLFPGGLPALLPLVDPFDKELGIGLVVGNEFVVGVEFDDAAAIAAANCA